MSGYRYDLDRRIVYVRENLPTITVRDLNQTVYVTIAGENSKSTTKFHVSERDRVLATLDFQYLES